MFAACSGGVIEDYYEDNTSGNEGEGPQRDHITDDTSLVTISMGGNDFGFGPVVASCISGNCATEDKAGEVDGDIDAQIDRLAQLYRDLASDAPPGARILVVGYPQMFPDEGEITNGGDSFISEAEQQWLNERGVHANSAIQEAIRRSGTTVEYVDVSDALEGHEIGTDDPWINDLDMGVDGGEWFPPASQQTSTPTRTGTRPSPPSSGSTSGRGPEMTGRLAHVSTLGMPVLLLSLALLAACGGEPSTAGAEDSPSSRTTAVSGGEAADYILTEDELPQGWRHATGEQHLGVPRMCDVTLEPPELSSAETQRFTRGFSGPFVIQYSFVAADEEAAAARTDEFVRGRLVHDVLPHCGVTIDVTEITDIEPVGESFAAVRGENRAAEGNDQEFVVFRNGAAVTVLQKLLPPPSPTTARSPPWRPRSRRAGRDRR